MIRNEADFFWPEFGICGLRPIDSHEISQLNELKFDLDLLREVQHCNDIGAIIMIEQMPIVGGYLGTVEQAIVSNCAAHLASFTLMSACYHLDGPIHVRWGITTARECLQTAGWVAAALDKNTNLLLANQYYTLAGPCTEMCLLEAAAQAITDTASGRELVSGVAAAKGVRTDYTTGMEARVMGEAALAATKLSINKANEVLNAILAKYDDPRIYKAAPVGKRYDECYDPVKVLPKEEYLKVYEKAMKTLEECGLPLKGIW